jgi:SMI1 / KNR4 family (SUKH-1)
MTLLEIEQQFALECPQTLKQLFQANLLGDFQHSANNALVAFAEDFEPLSVEQISQELIALYSPQDYRRMDPQFRFLPFGTSGGGDLYCLFLNHNPIDPPVVFMWHDNDCVDYLANNLSNFFL